MAKGDPPAVTGQASADLVATAIDDSALAAGWPLLDALPFPVLEIQADFRVTRMNPAAKRVYGDKLGECYTLSHGRDRPCDQEGESCPKLVITDGAGHASVRHAHQLRDGVEAHLVSAHPLANGAVLEFHMPLDDNLTRDGLTGLYQRDIFEQLVARQVSLLERMDVGYSITLINLKML